MAIDPAKLRREAAQLRARAAKQAEAEERAAREKTRLVAHAMLLEQTAAEFERLTTPDKARNIGRSMEVAAAAKPRRGRPIVHHHPFVDRVNVAEWCKSAKIPRRTVRDWMSGRISIPRDQAEAIHRAFGVPLSAWAKIS